MAFKAVSTKGKQTELRPTSEAIMAKFSELVLQVPELESGDISDILGPILSADKWDDLQGQDALPSSKTLIGIPLRVDSIGRKASDKPTATGFYLQCEGVNANSGEMVRFTAGGEQAVAVLSKLYMLDVLPAMITFVEVPLKSGNNAINCQVMSASGKGK